MKTVKDLVNKVVDVGDPHQYRQKKSEWSNVCQSLYLYLSGYKVSELSINILAFSFLTSSWLAAVPSNELILFEGQLILKK